MYKLNQYYDQNQPNKILQVYLNRLNVAKDLDKGDMAYQMEESDYDGMFSDDSEQEGDEFVRS